MNDYFYTWPKIKDIVESVKSGKVSASENAKKAIELVKKYNEDFDFCLQLLENDALDQAGKIDQAIAGGDTAGELLGVPFVVKDNFLTLVGKTTAASNMLAEFKAPLQATAVQKLLDQGAILIAKTNLDAFAHGSSTENSDFVVTKNPHDITKVPGGSSGGSAAAVRLGVVPFALGSDTGGSIRLPASYCGVVGLKPTYGAVSRYGVIAMASSTDVIGPFARSADDAARVFDCMTGLDKKDMTTINISKTSASLVNKDKLKIGVISQFLDDSVQADVKNSINQAVELFKTAGHSVENISIPILQKALSAYYVIVPAELSSNLSRFDGIKYGFSSIKSKDLESRYLDSRTSGFGYEAKRRIMICSYVLSSGYYDAYYNKAQKIRTKIIQAFEEAFEKFDVLIGPVAPTTAFGIGQKTNDPLQMYLEDVMTVGVSLAGLPSVSTPLKSAGMPVGLQIISKQKQDGLVMSLASQLEELQQ